jgi:hypothetical protein
MQQHEKMRNMPVDASFPTLPLIDSLAAAVASATAELHRLAAERRRLASLADGWSGGHRARYDDLLAALERRHVQLADGVASSALVLRRAREEAAR